ncbi:type II secretion system F family protein [Rhodoblastus sp.]|uniref:type II secretion system F family protein n=1 Tax=Rhodoblastus sp. TaxID=1962975 RepID=UPI003F94C3CE
MDSRSALIILLTVFAVSGGFYALVYPYLSGEAAAEKRREQVATKLGQRRGPGERLVDVAARRKQVADSLKEVEQRNAEKSKVSVETRIAQAGLSLSRTNFFVISGVMGAFFGILLFLFSDSLLIALAGPVIGGFGLPNFVLKFLAKRRLKKFADEFPNAVDVIVRGVKAGLPLNDTLRMIATEGHEPVRSEFRQIVEALALGLTVSEAVERLPQRIPTAEANYFAIVIVIQQKAGGNLGEALGNLSTVMRERKKMRDKVKALSAEAKASAVIIGALPIIVGVLLTFTNRQFIEMLWTTKQGRFMLVIAALMEVTGSFVMKKMIDFEV